MDGRSGDRGAAEVEVEGGAGIVRDGAAEAEMRPRRSRRCCCIRYRSTRAGTPAPTAATASFRSGTSPGWRGRSSPIRCTCSTRTSSIPIAARCCTRKRTSAPARWPRRDTGRRATRTPRTTRWCWSPSSRARWACTCSRCYLTGNRWAAAVGAICFAFCPFLFAHTTHIQLLMTPGIPFSMLAFHRLADRPTRGRGMVLGLAMASTALSCGYYGVFVCCWSDWRCSSPRARGGCGPTAATGWRSASPRWSAPSWCCRCSSRIGCSSDRAASIGRSRRRADMPPTGTHTWRQPGGRTSGCCRTCDRGATSRFPDSSRSSSVSAGSRRPSGCADGRPKPRCSTAA